MSDEEYFIICADFNVDENNHESLDYEQTIKRFKDAGYIVVNDGQKNTYPSSSECIDDMITSSNIIAKSFIVDNRKSENDDFISLDHSPMITYFEIF